MPSYKIYDLKYYDEELDKFEGFFQGEIMIGTIRMTREFIKCKDRLNKVKPDPNAYTYMTRMVDISQKAFATIVLVHGFAENTSNSMLE